MDRMGRRALGLAALTAAGLGAALLASGRLHRRRRRLAAEAIRQALLTTLDRARVAFDAKTLPLAGADGVDLAGLEMEHLGVQTEAGERCPLFIVRPKGCTKKLKPVFVLHGTTLNKLDLLSKGHLQRFARMGLVAIGVDGRHTGERVPTDEARTTRNPRGNQAYWDALFAAWRAADGPGPTSPGAGGDGGTGGTTHGGAEYRYPFIWDTVWDLMRVLDWIQAERADIDTSRVGVTGISLGGMQAWFWPVVDTRVTAAAPAIGVQSFRYGVDHDCWHARVDSLGPVFKAISAELSRPIDKDVVRDAWQKLLPGIFEHFDAEHSLACIAPRHLLVANSASDPRCPRAGVEEAFEIARPHWRGFEHRYRLVMDESNGSEPLPAKDFAKGHVITDAMWKEIDEFMARAVLRGEE